MWNVAFEVLALFDVGCEQDAEIDGCSVLGRDLWAMGYGLVCGVQGET